ncbi:glycine oxidase ThiO [Paenibacillus sp. SC116]|uniref:glycine oxidase ThiO n=1 Tax=Paenibacillus sp. SC116 TaxID=2968986 RepID=UPI00215AD98B|nr:glycine oxidase ThiO [Paenibacillus sp. SC116]MCR8842798.1 glycine oxidase ThiO [Paenibacillus sp. SC116]
MDHSRHSDVLIVGGSVIGCSVAYECAKLGLSVTVLERGILSHGTSRAAAGMLAPTAERFENKVLANFAYTSLELFSSWAEQLWLDSEVDLELRRNGLLIPVHSQQEQSLVGTALQNTAEKLDSGECRHIHWRNLLAEGDTYSYISPTVYGVYEVPHEGHVSPVKLMEALIAGARKRGVQFKEYQEVKKIIYENSVIRGVQTAEGTWTAEHVVICAGVDSNSFNEQTDVRTHFYPVKGELAVVRMDHAFDSILYGNGTYIVPKSGGHVYIGATSHPHRYDRKVNAGSITNLIQSAISYIPSLYEAELVTAWAGLRPATSDGLPYIGPVSHIKGLWLAAGHYRNGILLSAATGIGVASWIHSGKMPWSWMSTFDPLRHTPMPQVVH